MDKPGSGTSSNASLNPASAHEASAVYIISVGVYSGNVSVLIPIGFSVLRVGAGRFPMFICRPSTILNMTLFSPFLGFLN